jgi:hypothetical protein
LFALALLCLHSFIWQSCGGMPILDIQFVFAFLYSTS